MPMIQKYLLEIREGSNNSARSDMIRMTKTIIGIAMHIKEAINSS